MTDFKKGDRLRVIIEVTANEDSAKFHNLLWLDGIEEAGGTVLVEVLPKPVVLPMKKYAQVLVCENGKERFATLMTLDEVRPPSPWRVETEHFEAEHWTTELVGKHYVRTISEGVDE